MNKSVILRILLAVAGAVLVIVGIAEKDFSDVLIKATNICLECIGIG